MKPTFLALIASLFFLAACAAPATANPASASMPALTDPSQAIMVNTGDTFLIIVESNPSTGYHWEIVGDLKGIEFVSREFTQSEHVMPGSGGVEVWTFKAIAPGDASFTIGNYPPGDGTTYEQELKFSITVQ